MKLTIVVVFYKQAIDESKTFSTLRKALIPMKSHLEQVILYDNSPDKQKCSVMDYEDVPFTYYHDPRNLGIATAYNYALSAAKENGSEWLLLLDHDTEITTEYMEALINCDEQDSSVAAIVPKIQSENQMISPVFSRSLRPLQGIKPVEGIQENPVMAINSGALVRVDFLNKIGGFNEEFPLDYLDHWLFHIIYDKGYKVRLLDVKLDHELSVMDYSRVSLKRYQSILESEIKYFRNYQHDLYKAYRIQLAKRFLKQVLTVKNKKIALYTLRRFFTM